MSDKILNMLGLMRRANAIQIGETNTGAAVRGGKAKLLLLAADASDNARSRAEGCTRGRSVRTAALHQGRNIRQCGRERLLHGSGDGYGLCQRPDEGPLGKGA